MKHQTIPGSDKCIIDCKGCREISNAVRVEDSPPQSSHDIWNDACSEWPLTPKDFTPWTYEILSGAASEMRGDATVVIADPAGNTYLIDGFKLRNERAVLFIVPEKPAAPFSPPSASGDGKQLPDARFCMDCQCGAGCACGCHTNELLDKAAAQPVYEDVRELIHEGRVKATVGTTCGHCGAQNVTLDHVETCSSPSASQAEGGQGTCDHHVILDSPCTQCGQWYSNATPHFVDNRRKPRGPRI